MERIGELRSSWGSRLSDHRTFLGLRASSRAGSAVSRLLERLPEAPMVTATTVSRIFELSFPVANAASDELRGAEIVQTKKIGQGTSGYLAREVLDLVTMTERALASTKFDTRAFPPNRPAPARPRG